MARASALIISDGGMASVLAMHLETLAHGPQKPTGTVVWFCADANAGENPGSAERDRRRSACRRAAEACLLGTVVDAAGGLGGLGARGGGLAQTELLLAAGAEAISRGLSRVIWPVQRGGPGAGPTGSTGLDEQVLGLVLGASDRAVAAGRLLSLDAPEGGLTIETPLVDLTDVQVADLALDTDLPAGLVYLEGAEGPRWERAFASAGVPMNRLGSPAAGPGRAAPAVSPRAGSGGG
jgi:hypothetical protein